VRRKAARDGPAPGREEQSMIEAHQLTKRYGEKTAVDRLDFVVRPGAVTGFLGPNARASPPLCDQVFFANKIIY
jgi:ABC-type phosphonate transport system ATPase subunit